MQNPFTNTAFSMTALTNAMNILPINYGRVENLNLFPSRSVRFRHITIEEHNGVLSLLPTQVPGAPATIGKRGKRKVRTFTVPHIPHDDVVLPEEVQGIRAFGSESELKALQVNIRNLSGARKANFMRYEMSFSKSKFFKEVSSNGFKNINKKNEEGETILHQAVEISDYKTVRLLIKKGSEVNARDKKGYTPLHCAVFAKSLENVKVLLRSGAEVNATQYVTGCTPLHSACKIGGVEIIKELVKAGAEVNQLNKYGATPMYYIWESEKYCLCDSKESEKASKFLREKGGVTKSRELTCYGIERLVGEIADMLNGSYMPELKIIEIGEIRKRDKSLIKEECENLASKIMSQVSEMIDEGVKRRA